MFNTNEGKKREGNDEYKTREQLEFTMNNDYVYLG